ncbi:beta strand repeat-containing protein, partial [Larkinella harenae]
MDTSLPVAAPRFNITTGATETEWLNPALQIPSVTNLVFNKTQGNPAAGNFTFTVEGYAGNASLLVDVNNNNSYTDAVDRTIPIHTVTGLNTVSFDGLNGLGTVIGCGLTVGAKVLIDKPGEIHFTLEDVEGLGGLQVTATNGPSPHSNLYWNDQNLSATNRVNTTPVLTSQSNGTNSNVTGGVHGWGFGFTNTWGDNRYIDNWTFATQRDSVLTTLTTVCDFGDAPASYSTTADGPSHAKLGLLYIGSTVDAEVTGTASVSANSDDTTGLDDEDGVTSTPPILVECTDTYTLTVPVSNSTGSTAQLGGWIDFNRNGTFDAREFASVGVPNGATTATLTWSNIQSLSITAGQSFFRLRISTQAFSLPGGALPDGEVEDYPITILSALSSGVMSTSATGCAVADGTISLTATGGTGSFQYSLDGGITYINFTGSTSLTNLVRGGYTIIIRDANAPTCIREHQVVINATNCCDFNQNQPIVGQAVNPGAGFTALYLLTSITGEILIVSNTPSFPPQPVGSYYIRVLVYSTSSPAPTGVTVGQNVNGIAGCCFRLSPPTPVGICDCPTFTLLDNSYQVCAGQNLALLRVNTSATTPSQVEFVYFTTPQTSASAVYGGGVLLGTATPVSNMAQLTNVLFPSTAGTYYVYARISPAPADPNCRPYAEIPVTVNEIPVVTAQVSSNTVCVGGNLILSATASPAGSYTFTWTGPNNYSGTGATVSLTNVLATASGSYTVVATSVSGCSSSAVITNPVSVTVCCQDFGINLVTTNAHCGQNDGQATITANGGTAPYSYLWSNGSSNASLTGVAPGSFTVTVTDAVGCSTTALVTIGNVEGPQLVVNSTTPTTCIGATGVASVTAIGGTAPYSYLWNNGSTAANVSGLVAGVYSVTVTDAVGCSDVLPVEIESTPGSLTAIATSTASACGQAIGSINVTASGGTAPYNYLWNNGATSSSVNGLVAGVYSVTVIDANGCLASDEVIINDLTGPTVVTSSTAVSCNGSNTGIALATASGGTAPYTYLWSNGATTANINGLAAGDYNVVVTDANGCQASGIVSLTQPAGIEAELSASTVACGSSTGTITLVSISGGTTPYTYLWSNGSTSANLTDVAVGSYTVVVTDANGCVAIGYATLASPTDCPPCQQPVLTVSGPVCNTATNTYSIEYVASVGATITASVGTVVGTSVLNIPLGSNVVLTATNGCGVVSTTAVSPTDCTIPPSCTQVAELTVGQAVCVGTGSYVVSVTASSGSVITVQGGTYANGVITGVVGSNVTVVATLPGCGTATALVASPADCSDPCTSPLISLAGPTCDGATYSVRYTVPAGVTVVASTGVVSNGLISGIALGTPVSVTALNGVCPAQVVSLASPTDCPPCQQPVLTVSGPVCNTATNTYSIEYVASVGATIT